MRPKTCICRKWELTGTPCKHVVAINGNIARNGINVDFPEKWVHPTYWIETWKEMYNFKIEPINGRAYWLEYDRPTTLVAPNHHKQI